MDGRNGVILGVVKGSLSPQVLDFVYTILRVFICLIMSIYIKHSVLSVKINKILPYFEFKKSSFTFSFCYFLLFYLNKQPSVRTPSL